MRKFNAKKIGVCVVDSVDTTKVLLYGNYFNEALAAGDWTEYDVRENLDRFFSGDWGTVSSKVKALNDKHLEEGKGNLTGQYENRKLVRRDPMIIFYSEYNDCIYVLNQEDFDRVEEAWMHPQEKYDKEFTFERTIGAKPNKAGVDGSEKIRVLPESIKYGEHGHQLKPEQKESLRQEYPARSGAVEELSPEESKEYKRLVATSKRRELKPDELEVLKTLNEKVDKINAEKDQMDVQKEIIHYAGTVNQSEIDATQAAIESGVGANGRQIAGLPNNIVETLHEAAESRGHTYEELIELIAETTQITHKNLPESIKYVLSNIDKPFFFADSKKNLKKDSKVADVRPEWLDDEAIDEIVYDRAWPLSVNDVAKELVKKGVRRLDSARNFVRDYVKNNPSERKHFKDEDFEDFTTHTHQGYEVVTLYENDEGRLFIVGYRPARKDYFVGAGYNTYDGIWAQGYYDFRDEKTATDFLYDRYGWQNLEVKYHK